MLAQNLSVDLDDWNMPTSICGTCFLVITRTAEQTPAFLTRLIARLTASKIFSVKDATRRCQPDTCKICTAASPLMKTDEEKADAPVVAD